VHNVVVVHNHSQLAALVQIRFTQALAAQEGIPAVAEDGSGVEPHAHQPPTVELSRRFDHAPNDPNLDAFTGPIAQETDHRSVTDLGVVNQQLFLGAYDEVRQLLPRIDRTYHEALVFGLVRLAPNVGVEKSRRFLDGFGIVDDQPETPAVFDVKMGVVERQNVQDSAVHDHELVVVAQKIVRSTRDLYAHRQQIHLQLPQILLFPMIRVRDESVNGNTSIYSLLQCVLDVYVIESEDGDLNAFLSSIDLFDQ
jgi:hypothetical protein